MSGEREEQLILRINNRSIAEKIKNILSEDPNAPKDVKVELHFDEKGGGRTGTFTVGNESLPFVLQDLPTIVESFKTYDDINLVKTTDIGQMVVVGSREYIEQLSNKARHGITPPMREVRKRLFAKLPKVDAAAMSKLDEDLLLIASGQAPAGVEFIDVEEEYVVDEAGHGSWQPVAKQASKGSAPAAGTPGKRQKSKQGPSTSSGPPPDVEEF